MRKLIALSVLALAGCGYDPVETKTTNNRDVPVSLLFTHEGCSVYRFYDAGSSRYYANCGNSSAGWRESCGKNCQRDMSVSTP